MNDRNNRAEMLRRVQQMNFVMIDVGLFLNNQPENRAALELFGKYQALYAKAKREFEDLFGPLNYEGIRASDGWTWLQEPWPWEVEE